MTLYSAAIALENAKNAKEAYNILLPGSHLVCICKPLEYHRTACDIEDVGFEIRDQIVWLSKTPRNIVLARKPFEKTIAENVIKYETGGLNIDACRVLGGRFPANIIHDGSEEILNEFIKYGESKSGVDKGERGKGGMWSKSSGKPCGPQYGDTGGIERYFKSIKDLSELKEYLITLILPPNGKLYIIE